MNPLYAPEPDTLSILFVTVVILGTVLYDHFTPDDPDPFSPEARRQRAHDAYSEGRIDHTELERILETTEDPHTKRIQALVRPINGVGPKTSWAVAEHFDSPEDLRDADRDELEKIHGVGPSLSEAIAERFD
ncbi:helix-hairpin-helix domain-containing protein [Halomontanus rarus]|uniref:helix-hairpin-helix domain-containing protein n=1 Tax=Halomontanus rarus TaxID=3034020 RepID=UPI00307CC127